METSPGCDNASVWSTCAWGVVASRVMAGAPPGGPSPATSERAISDRPYGLPRAVSCASDAFATVCDRGSRHSSSARRAPRWTWTSRAIPPPPKSGAGGRRSRSSWTCACVPPAPRAASTSEVPSSHTSRTSAACGTPRSPWSSRARTRIRTSTRTSRARASPTSVSTPSTVSDDPVAPALSLDPSLSRRISRWAPSAPKHSCA